MSGGVVLAEVQPGLAFWTPKGGSEKDKAAEVDPADEPDFVPPPIVGVSVQLNVFPHHKGWQSQRHHAAVQQAVAEAELCLGWEHAG